MEKSRRIVLGVTGSIAAYKSAEIVRGFCKKGFKVSVVMTHEATRFITPLTLATLSGEQVYSGMFIDENLAARMPHIDLAEKADAVLIAPATANIIGKIAAGLADDLLTCIVLGTKAPIFIAPAMNTEMYKNKIVQANCAKLKALGFYFIDPVEGQLACGVIGDGHIACEDEIVKAVAKVLK